MLHRGVCLILEHLLHDGGLGELVASWTFQSLYSLLPDTWFMVSPKSLFRHYFFYITLDVKLLGPLLFIVARVSEW